MKLLVVDASVAIKWCVPGAGESLVSQATELMEAYARGKVGFVVPDLFWAEFGNILRKGVRRGKSSVAEAATALELVRNMDLPTIGTSELSAEAITIAIKYGRSVYDSLYVALASRSETELITADERLANALAAHLPVKWLGAL